MTAADGIWNEGSIDAWRRRGLDLWHALAPGLAAHVPTSAVERLLAEMIHARNPACADASNAAHVMAQNDNLIVLASWAEAPEDVLAVALTAGFIHDLNKAEGEELRGDQFGVRTQDGRPLERMTTEAEVVGLNHYGARTHRALQGLVEDGLLLASTAARVDACIVHHGLGSSRFIRELVRGELGFGREDFLTERGEARYLLPAQPSPTLATVLHDLADSVQQMQAGAAWVSKYPLGYWRSSGSTWLELLSGDGKDGDVPTGLEGQLRTELSTCQGILREAIDTGIVNRARALRLERGVEGLVESGREWVDARRDALFLPRGKTIFHQIGSATAQPPIEVRAWLGRTRPGEDDELDERILRAAQSLDSRRAHQLHEVVARGRS